MPSRQIEDLEELLSNVSNVLMVNVDDDRIKNELADVLIRNYQEKYGELSCNRNNVIENAKKRKATNHLSCHCPMTPGPCSNFNFNYKFSLQSLKLELLCPLASRMS